MYVKNNQITPYHYHRQKKEDIICRWGKLIISLRAEEPVIKLQVNGTWQNIKVSEPLILKSGERLTLTSGVRHSFWAESEYAIVG